MQTIQISALDQVFARITLTAKNADGTAATPSAVHVAFVSQRMVPDATTTWYSTTLAASIATILVSGPAVSPPAGLPVPSAGADMWVRIFDGSEIQVVPGARFSILAS